jgi:uncharacterized protein (TIGR02145 family)
MSFNPSILYIYTLGILLITSCHFANEEDDKISNTLDLGNKQLSIKDSILVDNRNHKTYRIRRLNNLWWMIDNLNYPMKGTLFKDNIYIGTGSYCYNDDPSNCEKYGQLYDYPSAKKACPKGWRLPTQSEWKTLNDKYKNCDPSIDSGLRHKVPLFEPIGSGKGTTNNINYIKYDAGTDNIVYFGLDDTAYYWCAADEEVPNLKVMISLIIELNRCVLDFTSYMPKDYLASFSLLSCRCVQEAN